MHRQVLDSILAELTKSDKEYFRNSYDLQQDMGMEFLNKSLQMYLEELIRRGFAVSNNYTPNPSYMITIQGLVFFENGGFLAESQRNISQASQTKNASISIKTQAITILVITLLSLVVDIYFRTSEKNSIDKEVLVLRNKVDSLTAKLDHPSVLKNDSVK